MQYKFIGRDKDGAIGYIRVEQDVTDDGSKPFDTTVESHPGVPHPDFVGCFDDFTAIARKLLGLDTIDKILAIKDGTSDVMKKAVQTLQAKLGEMQMEQDGNLEVRSVKIKELADDELQINIQCVMTGPKKHKMAMNCPKIDTGKDVFGIERQAFDLVDALRQECNLFVDGAKRGEGNQNELDFDGKPDVEAA